MRDAEECRKGGDVCVDMWNIRVGAGIGLWEGGEGTVARLSSGCIRITRRIDAYY